MVSGACGTGGGRRVWIAATVLVAVVTSPACRKQAEQTEAPDSQRGQATRITPTTQEVQDILDEADVEAEVVDLTTAPADYMAPVVQAERFLLATFGGQPVGYMRYAEVTFQRGAVRKSQFEFFLMPDADGQWGHRMWHQRNFSELADGRPMAEWCSSQWGKKAASFRLRAARPPTFERNYFGWPTGRQPFKPVAGAQLWRWMQAQFKANRRPGATFEWKRLDWVRPEPGFQVYTVWFEADETIETVDGRPVATGRFRAVPEDGEGGETVFWLDDDARPVQIQWNGKNGLKVRWAEEKTAKDTRALTWDEVVDRFGAEAALTTRPAEDGL